MNRGKKNAFACAKVTTVVFQFPEGEVPFGGVLVGKTLILHVDEVQNQNWISEHKDEVIALLQESFCRLDRILIYANTHK